MSADVMAKLEQIHRDVQSIAKRVNASSAAPVFDNLSVEQFAEKVGRSNDWVYNQIRLRRVKTLPGGKPYRIAPSELQRFFQAGAN